MSGWFSNACGLKFSYPAIRILGFGIFEEHKTVAHQHHPRGIPVFPADHTHSKLCSTIRVLVRCLTFSVRHGIPKPGDDIKCA